MSCHLKKTSRREMVDERLVKNSFLVRDSILIKWDMRRRMIIIIFCLTIYHLIHHLTFVHMLVEREICWDDNFSIFEDQSWDEYGRWYEMEIYIFFIILPCHLSHDQPSHLSHNQPSLIINLSLSQKPNNSFFSFSCSKNNFWDFSFCNFSIFVIDDL